MLSAENLFFKEGELNRQTTTTIIQNALHGLDDGELFLEYRQTEALAFDDGSLKTASFNTSQGFGLRGVQGELAGYAHANTLTEQAIKEAANTIKGIQTGKAGTLDISPQRINRHLYTSENPIDTVDFKKKVDLLAAIDAYVRTKDSRIRQVNASLASDWQAICILRADGSLVEDIRPLVRLNVSVVMAKGDRRESAAFGSGGRHGLKDFLKKEIWQPIADEALRQCGVNMEAVDAPAGQMDVVLGPGWPGVLLHEAVGHGLEGDFNRKGTSAFAGLRGEQVAAKGVTVVDDGTLENKRGSLTIDDEGTPTEPTVLIEDGILKSYMQDRMNARLMGEKPTGNGRRESHAHAPMPRMTNTFMLNGNHDPDEVLAAAKDGIYAVNFGGGQVDITSGKFVFSCTEAYRIRNGKVEEPVKGATLIGSGPEVLKRVKMIGNDLALDPGVGTCGKGGQSVPAGVGQPTLLVENLTIGGTA